jgi:hypothetical protein
MRRVVQVGVLFLAVRVLVDLATPLLPGAFGIDASVSVAAATTSQHAASNPPATVPPSMGRSAGVQSRSAAESTRRRRDPEIARPLLAPTARITCLAERVASSPLSDDD